MLDPLQAVYDRIPKLDCKGLCQQSCGPISYEEVEGARCGYPAVRADGPDPFRCDKLSVMGLCSVYENRPAICRLWGIVRDMRCPHGCVPERWLTREQGFEILAAVRELSGS